jgi:hypothetical protein
VLVEELEDVLEYTLKLPEELTSESALAHLKLSMADEEKLPAESKKERFRLRSMVCG